MRVMAKTSFTPEQVKEALLVVASRIIVSEPVLSEADRNLGDGDHGLGMQRGFTAAQEKLAALPAGESLDKLFSSTGMALISSMGGASGALFGTLFRDGGKALAGKESFGAEELALFLEAANTGVQARGKAKPGDKTMIDALAPAAEKAREVWDRPLHEALAAVADAAEAGKDASKDYVAVFGRAKSLGQGAIGFPDAGALSVTIILQALRDFATV